MKIIFLEAGPTMIAKNLLPIARNIAEAKPVAQIVFVSIDILSHEDHDKEFESIKNLKELGNAKLQIVKSLHPSAIHEYLIEEQPTAIVFGAYRIYDMLWTAIAKSIGIKVFSFQHGYEVDSVYYKYFIVFNKFFKTLRIVVALYYLSKIMGKDFFSISSQYLKYFFRGKRLFNSYFNTENLQPDHIFIYSDYYREFWHRKFGFNPATTIITGAPDLMEVHNIKTKPKINGCCYLTQTLVEDGRITKRELISILDSYKEIAEAFENFIIKLHPRGDKDLYSELSKLPNVKLVREFPNCGFYFTHYSSTAYVARHITPEVVIHELDGHPTPDIFIESGFSIVKNTKGILQSFKRKPRISLHQQHYINWFSPLPERDPYKVVANNIVEITQ